MISQRTFRLARRVRTISTYGELSKLSGLELKEKWDKTVKELNSMQKVYETVLPGAEQITPSWENKFVSKLSQDQAKSLTKSILSQIQENPELASELAKLGAQEYNIENVYTLWKQSWAILNNHLASQISEFNLKDEKQAKLFKRHLGALAKEHSGDEEYIKMRRQIGETLVEKVFGYKLDKYNLTDSEALAYFALSVNDFSKYVSTFDKKGMSDEIYHEKVIIPAMHIAQLVALKRHDENNQTKICSISGWLNFALHMDDIYYQTI